MRKFKSRKAQTAIELAVFGAILIFVMGSLIRTVMGRALQQHAMLKATRMALTISQTTTASHTVAGRNMGTVLVVEDRLTAASSKYGSVDRMPFMTQGSGTHSANLFMPIDYGYDEDLPVFDLYVNGKHFAFRVGSFKYVYPAASCRNLAVCHADCIDEAGMLDCTATSPYFHRGASIPAGPEFWEPGCLQSTVTITQILACAGAGPCPAACTDCGAASTETYTTVTSVVSNIGCAKFYMVVNNHPLIPAWCNGGVGTFPIPCPGACSMGLAPGCNLSVTERFNLDRADVTNPNGLDGLPGVVTVPVGERPGFAWQWYLVAAIDDNWTQEPLSYGAGKLSSGGGAGTTTVITDASLQMAEGLVFPGGEARAKNCTLDIDYDLKGESVIGNTGYASPNVVTTNGIITRMGVMDPQEGDIDFSYNESDELRGLQMYGFTKDINIYTYVHGGGPGGGTYLQIDEGQLFSGAGDARQFIRTASKKDQVDLIERAFRLSNDIGTFCGLVVGGGPSAPPVNGLTTNPVEVCGWNAGDCFLTGNSNRTCMDVPNKIIFIRSRIQDVRGRKWVTDESVDPYVSFVIN
ncbi:MAG: hypothetical protein KAS92_03945 [Candidatus Omnitrophica bacterium]|nr:hypothetical protein [Candidatus Omnitrophota bacterium]